MHFEGVLDVSAPKERVFAVITDPHQMSGCFPDLRSLEVKSADEFDAVIGVRFGVITGKITMNFRAVEKEPPSRAKLLGHGVAFGSAVDLEIVTELAGGAGGGTSMKWAADATVSGKIASLGQGLVSSQAEKIVRPLFDCLRKKLE